MAWKRLGVVLAPVVECLLLACGSGGIVYQPSDDDGHQQPGGDSQLLPPVPLAVNARAGSRQVEISWAGSPDTDSFRVYWGPAAGVSRQNGTAIDADQSPLLHAGLTNGTPYFYVVTALGSGGESPESAEVSATPNLAIPTGTFAAPGNGLVVVSWSPVFGASGYGLYWAASPGVTKLNGLRIQGAISPFAHHGLTNGTTTYYVVTAVDGAEESAESLEVNATPQLSAPQNFSANPGDGECVLNWDDVSGATGYSLTWWQTNDPMVGAVIPVVAPPFAHTGRINGMTYSYQVRAVDAASEGAASAIVSVRAGPPDPPSGVSAVPGYQRVVVSWSAVAGATSYNLYWANSSPVTAGNAILGVSSPHDHGGLSNGLPYHYVVAAVGPGGESVASNEVTAIPGLFPPSNLMASPGNGEVTLSWDASAGGTSYTLNWGLSPGVDQGGGTAIPGVNSPFLHAGIPNGTRHYYAVTASDGSVTSGYSNEVSAMPRLPAPANLSVAPGDQRAVLRWQMVTGAEAYNLYWGTGPGSLPNQVLAVTSPFEHSGLTNHEELFWAVTAVDANDESPPSNQVVATPGPRWLIYRYDRPSAPSELYLVRMPEGVPGTPQLLASGDSESVFGFSHHGDRLWYLVRDQPAAALDLYVVGIGSGAPGTAHRVSSTTTLGVVEAGFSPDGEWLAYLADQDTAGELDLYLADSHGLPPIAATRVNHSAGVGRPTRFFFSSDSRRLFYLVELGHLFCVDLATGHPAGPVSLSGSSAGAVSGAELAWQGGVYAFRADFDSAGEPQLYFGDMGSGCVANNPTKVTTAAAVSTANLSPEGDLVALMSEGRLYVAATQPGAAPSPVTDSGDVALSRWSRDGRWLAYIGDSQTPGRQEVFAAAKSGTNMAQPTKLNPELPSGGAVTTLAITRDSRLLYYLADQEIAGLVELFVVDVSGATPGQAQKVNQTLAHGGGVLSFAPSYDGRAVVYAARQNATNAEELQWVDLSTSTPGAPQSLTGGAAPGVSLGGNDPSFDPMRGVFTLDDGFVLYLRDHEILGRPELYLVDLTDPASPTKINQAISAGGINRFAWSPLLWAPKVWDPTDW